MLNLRIFILLVLAGLCFGASLEAGDQTSEAQGKEKQTDSKGQGSEDQEENTQPKTLGASLEAEGDQTSGGNSQDSSPPAPKQPSEQEEKSVKSSEGQEEKTEPNGEENRPHRKFADAVGLPSWIKNVTNFMNSLLGICHNQNLWERISNDTIHWENCTFDCRHDIGAYPHVEKLPNGTPCGIGKICDKNACVGEPTTLPSCR
uniref:Putative ixodes 8-cys protein n=1 Tax=Ixodes ricinus TaxID=34613 RepID=A0A0K8RH71_IXORI